VVAAEDTENLEKSRRRGRTADKQFYARALDLAKARIWPAEKPRKTGIATKGTENTEKDGTAV
jgi:hypothetical protein